MSSMRAEPYVTVVAWPSGRAVHEVLAALLPLTGSDMRTLELRAKGEPPLILGRFPPAVAARVLAGLIELGGDGFTVSMEQLAALGPSRKIRDMRVTDGGLALELWRGPPETLALDRIEILVRAHLSDKLQRSLGEPPGGAIRLPPSELGLSFASPRLVRVLGGRYYGMATASDPEPPEAVRTSDKLDIHTTDGRVLQIDGDKFGFRVLGDLRGHGDKANMDRTLELLGHIAPKAIVDPYFPLWRRPPGADRFRLPRMHVDNEDPRFAFYSRWTATLYRHLLHP